MTQVYMFTKDLQVQGFKLQGFTGPRFAGQGYNYTIQGFTAHLIQQGFKGRVYNDKINRTKLTGQGFTRYDLFLDIKALN